MTDMGPTLSAYLDGALTATERQTVEAQLAADAGLRAELAALTAANAAARDDFAAMLDTPVPLALASALRNAPAAEPPKRKPTPWLAIAASLTLLAVGALGGYVLRPDDPARDWAADVAEYHAVYAAQTRHLVEVPADQSDHIVKWLTAQVGTPVTIPDLSTKGLEFQGARLLVAAGKPVGQLMYRDPDGQVVALCVIAGDNPATDGLHARNFGAFDAQVWGRDGASFILIAPKGFDGLADVAAAVKST